MPLEEEWLHIKLRPRLRLVLVISEVVLSLHLGVVEYTYRVVMVAVVVEGWGILTGWLWWQ